MKREEEEKTGNETIKREAHTMNRLIYTITPTLPIRNPAQTRRRAQPDGARDRARLITDDVAEQITRDQHAVERGRVLEP